ncbi:MAG: hypothetical protein R3A12_10215 [Ignavibacteria bacterium]
MKKFKPNKIRIYKTELNISGDINTKERKAIFESAKANMEALVDKIQVNIKVTIRLILLMKRQKCDEMEREKIICCLLLRDEKYLDLRRFN